MNRKREVPVVALALDKSAQTQTPAITPAKSAMANTPVTAPAVTTPLGFDRLRKEIAMTTVVLAVTLRLSRREVLAVTSRSARRRAKAGTTSRSVNGPSI